MKNVLFLISIALILGSCKKEETPTPVTNNPTIGDFSQLAIGNWWVYSAGQIDSSGISTIGTGRDTIRIVRDTLINGNSYYIAEGSYRGGLDYTREYWRDSADCLINESGKILFCFGRFNQIIRRDSVPGQYTSEYVVDINSSTVGTGVGTLPCYIMNVTYNYISFGQRNWHYKYTVNVGRVKWRIDDPNMPFPYEQRLINYFVQ